MSVPTSAPTLNRIPKYIANCDHARRAARSPDMAHTRKKGTSVQPKIDSASVSSFGMGGGNYAP